MQKDIARSAKLLEDAYRKSDVQPAQRRLRSTSTQIEFPFLSKTASPRITSRTPLKQSSSAPSKSLTPSGVKRETEQTQPPVERYSLAKKKRRQLPKKVRLASYLFVPSFDKLNILCPANRGSSDDEGSKDGDSRISNFGTLAYTPFFANCRR
jgi:hypothetical protein